MGDRVTPNTPLSVYIGFDPREAAAFAVAKFTARTRTRVPVPINGIVLDHLRDWGLYTRATSQTVGATGKKQLFDDISDAPMSTEFAISRFFTLMMARRGWALFMDADVLVRASLMGLFDQADPTKAVMCVKHQFEPPKRTKMDGQAQLRYARKCWSSVALFNCDHPANKALTLDLLNSAPGRDLHAFSWLPDELIGNLDPAWNWLVGHSDPAIDPKIVHFTDGTPDIVGYEDQPFADEWRAELADWAGARDWC